MKALINVKNVTKSFYTNNKEVPVIKGITCEIFEGDFTVIMGSSGSGKSTLLYLLSGLDQLTSGEISFDDIPLQSQNEKYLSLFRRKELGFVFQAIHLIPHLSLFENLLIPAYLIEKDRKKAQSKAHALLETLDLKEETHRLPSQVSGGQQQRAAIGRALINAPRLLFADEPTGALNSTHGENVLDLLTKINEKGQSIIMVTHDVKAAIRANRILYLRDGQVTGELSLDPYQPHTSDNREAEVFTWLQEKGW